ncbi:hypothetical protein LLG34_01285 [bacterium]|nr:hypothetical protein [bacterium]
MKKYLIIILVIVFCQVSAHSQFLKNTSFALGLSTSQILGNNPAGKPIVSTGDADPAVIGGGFFGAQPGIDFRVTIPIDKELRWRIPIGLDYQFFSAKERIPTGKNLEVRLRHSLTNVSPYVGVSYVLQNLEMIKAKTYASLEARASFINNINYEREHDYLNSNDLDTTLHEITKSNATRYGGLMRVGVESYLFYPIQINASVGLSVMNLLGRDNARHELLTPTNFMEVQESFIWNLNFSIMFQYTF